VNTSEQELVKLNQCFLDHARQVIQTRFGEQETVTWSFNCGFPEAFGYVLLSSKRVFTVQFVNPDQSLIGGRKRIIYDKQETLWRDFWGGYSQDKGFYLPPSSELTKKEQSSCEIREARLNQISGVNRQDYEVRLGADTETIVFITVDSLGKSQLSRPIFYTYEDGQFFYTFLSDLSRKNAPGVGPVPKSDIASLIEALANLHQAGVLTDEEFDSKKRDLLSRI
jgi:hypothetical protein